MVLRNLKLLRQEGKEGFYEYLARWMVNVTHMVDQSSKVNQVRLFISNLQPIYREHLQFMLFENFIALRNVGMQVEEKLSNKALAKSGCN